MDSNLEKLDRVHKAIEKTRERLHSCDLCPKKCHVNRYETSGFCMQRIEPRVSATVLHFGEEPPLVKEGGAGAVFFSGCTMSCLYCQNFAFSQKNAGKVFSFEELSRHFMKIQEEGAACIDLVTPTPNLYGFLKAYELALEEGFSLPVVFNTSGYEEVSTLQLLNEIVDIYLTDIRYTDDALGEKYSLVPDYWTVTKKAVKEMFRQTGSFREERMRGVIVRHLVLPEGIAGTEEMAEFVAFELSSSVPISLMSQYRPVYRAREHYELSRKISEEEYDYALDVIDRFGLTGWMQHSKSKENFRAKPLRWD